MHLLDHADSLDDSAVPLRSVDGAGVEGADPAVAGERGDRDDGAAVRLEPLVAVCRFRSCCSLLAGVIGVNAKRMEITPSAAGEPAGSVCD